jgi:hypothetical protein
MAFYLKRASHANYLDLLRAVPVATLPKASRSTVPLLDFWRDTEQRLNALGEAIGLNLAKADLHFGYAVSVPRGVGKHSFTDLMLITSDAGVAIEAKFTEPPYENVTTWLGPEGSVNRREVLAGWLGLIASATSIELTPRAGRRVAIPTDSPGRIDVPCSATTARSRVSGLRPQACGRLRRHVEGLPSLDRPDARSDALGAGLPRRPCVGG